MMEKDVKESTKKDKKEKTKKTEEKTKLTPGKLLKKLFGGIEMTWKRVIIFAVLAGIYTALMAMLAPDGNSFHDIAATPEAWVLLAMIVIVNCKKPLEAALKTFVFFLISQPLVYLIQVPFNSLGWQLFQYYPYWLKITLLTLPGGYIAWFTKKDNAVAGLIFSVASAYLVFMGVNYIKNCADSFPNHLLSAIYCFAIIPIMSYALFTKRSAKATVLALATVALIASLILVGGAKEELHFRSLNDYGIEYGTDAGVTFFSGTRKGNVTLIDTGEYYNLKLEGTTGGEYEFEITNNKGEVTKFKYHYEGDELILTKVND